MAAIPLGFALARGAAVDSSLRAWNMFGALDLLAAVGTGVVSAEGSPIRIIHWGVGSVAMQHLPFSLAPTVLVPFYLSTHGIVAARLAARISSRRRDARASPVVRATLGAGPARTARG